MHQVRGPAHRSLQRRLGLALRIRAAAAGECVRLRRDHRQGWAQLVRSAMRGVRATLFSAVARHEFDDQARCLETLRTVGPSQAPTRILVSTRISLWEGADFQTMIRRQRDDWLRLTGAPVWVPVANSSHYIQRDAPAAMVRAIEELASSHAAQ